MEIGPLQSFATSRPESVHGSGRMLRMQQKLEELESSKESVEETDELDTNKDGFVDKDELQAAGLLPTQEVQSTQDFLALRGVTNNTE